MIIQKNNGKVVPQQSGREKFKMVAKTMMGLEEVLAEELLLTERLSTESTAAEER